MEGANLEYEAASRVGRILRSKWRLERVLGVGGMASVYAATHRNGMRGAVKILHAGVARDADARERFLREGYLANRVPKGAVRVLDDDTTEDGTPFIVMELLEGSTVDALACSRAGDRLEIGEVLGIGLNLLDILVGAHGIGLVHRDIKPENLFLTSGGELRLLDFGIARLREQSGAMRATSTTSMMGTPAFMPPEQALARWEEVGPQSDIYSVGATLFTLLTGQITHVARTAPELLVAVATQRARPLRTLHPGVPVALAEVVDRALAHEPARRWETAAVMKEALELAARLSTAEPRAGLDEAATVEIGTRPVPSSLPRPVDPATATLASASAPASSPDAHLLRRPPTHIPQVLPAPVPARFSSPDSFANETSNDVARAMSKTASPVSSDHALKGKNAKAPILLVGFASVVLLAALGATAVYRFTHRQTQFDTGVVTSTSQSPAASEAVETVAPRTMSAATATATSEQVALPSSNAPAPSASVAAPVPSASGNRNPVSNKPRGEPPRPSAEPPKPPRHDLDLSNPN